MLAGNQGAKWQGHGLLFEPLHQGPTFTIGERGVVSVIGPAALPLKDFSP
jgi:hypothetical protein